MSKKKGSQATGGTTPASTKSSSSSTTQREPEPEAHRTLSPNSVGYFIKPSEDEVTSEAKKLKKEKPKRINKPQPAAIPIPPGEDSTSGSSTDSDEEVEEEDPSIIEAVQQISLEPTTKDKKASKKMTQAHVDVRKKKAFAHKVDIMDKIPSYPLEKIKSNFVNRSLWEHSGAIVRVFNCDIPDMPKEVGIFRLKASHPEHIPAILANEEAKFKGWALQQVKASTKKACHNVGEEDGLTMEEWGIRYVVASLSDYGKRFLGDDEPGLWVLHCPEYIEESVRAKYDDGSEDRCHIIKMYINLVPPEFRIRQIEGGWGRKSDEPEEKRKAPAGRNYSRPFRPYNNRPYMGPPYPGQPYPGSMSEQVAMEQAERMAQKAAERAAEIFAARSKAKTDHFPTMPESKNPAAIKKMMWPETDIPNISYQL